MAMPPKSKPEKNPSVVTLKASNYQPNARELREDLRVDVSFEEALGALVKPVKVETAPRKKNRDFLNFICLTHTPPPRSPECS